MIVQRASGGVMLAVAAVMRWALATLTFLATPEFLSALALLSGCGLLIMGVYTLWGLGWALIAGAVPPLLVGAVLLRGVIHG